ncbi:MAG: hypothetical protein ACXVCY_05410 [Pseudobdellovibrionaceae bacterium]
MEKIFAPSCSSRIWIGVGGIVGPIALLALVLLKFGDNPSDIVSKLVASTFLVIFYGAGLAAGLEMFSVSVKLTDTFMMITSIFRKRKIRYTDIEMIRIVSTGKGLYLKITALKGKRFVILGLDIHQTKELEKSLRSFCSIVD